MPDTSFLESHVRSLYRLLGHKKDEYTDVKCIDVNAKQIVHTALVQGEEAFVSWAKKYNGHGNCFVGRNPRSSDRKVCRISSFSLDIDPEREIGTAATEVQVQDALSAARVVGTRFGGAYAACSGNGALILYRPEPFLGPAVQFERALQRFQDEAQKLCPAGVKVDATHDSARLIKVIGTMSTKGDKKAWRVSNFLSLPNPPYRTSPALKDFLARENEQLLDDSATQRILSTGPGLASPTARLKDAEDAMQRLGPHRAEDYHSWLKVGLALKEFGDVGLQLWDQWSRKSPKYSAGDCARKWQTFGRSILDDAPKVTVGTIIGWANEDNPARVVPLGGVPDLSGLYSPNGNLVEHKRRLLERGLHGKPELPTGLGNLDRHTWGFVRGELFVIAARTGIGKTSIATCVTRNLLQEGKRVLFFSTEMAADLIVNRLISSKEGIDGECFKTGVFKAESLAKLDAGYTWLEGVGRSLAICDSTSPSIEKVKALANAFKPDVLVFDHIQRVGGKSDSIRHNISEFIRGLKDTARTNDCAVLVLSQLRRMFRDIKTGMIPPPQMSDLKESGTIEEEAGSVLLLSVLSEKPDEPVCQLLGSLEKNRFGETCKVGITFDRSKAIFTEMGVQA